MYRKFLPVSLVAFALLTAALPAAAGCKLTELHDLPVRMQDLRPMVRGQVNGQEVRLAADSGGFFSTLTPSAAARLGLTIAHVSIDATVVGATGEAQVRRTRARDFSFAGEPLHNVDFLVVGPDEPGVDGFLGQNLLSGADTEFDLANGHIRLFHADDCSGQPLAYWDRTDPYSELELLRVPGGQREREIDAIAFVNGVRMRAILDTGAPRSMLTMSAAKRAGIERDGQGVTAAGQTGGVGRRVVDTWIAPVQSFKVGDEEIRNTRLRIGEVELPGADMLLGADFFLSHRIYVARGQRKIYFTYNGGPVFRLDRVAPGVEGPPAAPAGAAPAAARVEGSATRSGTGP